MFDRIVSKTFYNEKEARDLVRTLLRTVKHLHDQSIIHRDLKVRQSACVQPSSRTRQSSPGQGHTLFFLRSAPNAWGPMPVEENKNTPFNRRIFLFVVVLNTVASFIPPISPSTSTKFCKQ